MKRIYIFGLLLSLTLITPQITFAATSTEPVADVFNKAMSKWLTNSAGHMYTTDNINALTSPRRYEITADLFLFTKIANGTSSVSTSTVEFSLHNYTWKQIKDVSKGIVYTHDVLDLKTYINGVQTPNVINSDAITKLVNGDSVESYRLATDVIGQTDTVDMIAKKLKTRGVPKTIRDKVFKKLTKAEYLKLNAQETLQGIYSSLGLEEEKDISKLSFAKNKTDLVYFLNNIVKISKDQGTKNITLTHLNDLKTGSKTTELIPARVVSLSLDTDQLALKAIADKSVEDISFGYAKSSDSVDTIKETFHGLFDELSIEVWINEKTYDIEEIFVPQYLITNTLADRQTGFEFSFDMVKSDTGAPISLPKKFTTPKQIRSEYAKY